MIILYRSLKELTISRSQKELTISEKLDKDGIVPFLKQFMNLYGSTPSKEASIAAIDEIGCSSAIDFKIDSFHWEFGVGFRDLRI